MGGHILVFAALAVEHLVPSTVLVLEHIPVVEEVVVLQLRVALLAELLELTF